MVKLCNLWVCLTDFFLRTSFASNFELWTILGCARRSKIKIQKNIEYGRYIKSNNYSLKILKTAMTTLQVQHLLFMDILA